MGVRAGCARPLFMSRMSEGPAPNPALYPSCVWAEWCWEWRGEFVPAARCPGLLGGIWGSCPAPRADSYAFFQELVAELQLLASSCVALATSFGLTTGMKKMEVRDEPTAGEALGNPSVTIDRSMLPVICEFICFENFLNMTVPVLMWGCAFQAKELLWWAPLKGYGDYEGGIKPFSGDVGFRQPALRQPLPNNEGILGLTGMTKCWGVGMLQLCRCTALVGSRCHPLCAFSVGIWLFPALKTWSRVICTRRCKGGSRP